MPSKRFLQADDVQIVQGRQRVEHAGGNRRQRVDIQAPVDAAKPRGEIVGAALYHHAIRACMSSVGQLLDMYVCMYV